MATGGGEAGDGGSSDADSKSTDIDVEGLTRKFAKCKWFNVAKGFGFVSLEDSSQDSGEEEEEGKPPPDIFVYQSAIKMPGFRSLREGERVEVWYKKSDKGLEAVKVAGPGGSDCLGSEKRPKRRKKTADRCYNCDESGHHAKECTLPPMPKRCHHCKSVDHLVAKCQLKRDRNVTTSQTTSSQQGYGADSQIPHSNGQTTSNQPSTSSSGQYQETRYG